MFSIKVSAVTAVLLILLQASLIRCAHIPFVKREITPEERQYLDGLANSYKGIFWDVAYPGAGNEGGGCTIDQFNILVEATRMALDLADFSGTDILLEDAPTNRFFVRNSVAPEGGRWTSANNQAAYANLIHNMFVPKRFVSAGKGSGSRRTRVTYQCQDVIPRPPDTLGCAAGGPPAYTVQGSFTGTGVTTVFCPKFFAAGTYLNEITGGPPKTINDFGSPSLISYEQMIVHEWMHADVMDYHEHIDDIQDSVDQSDPTVRPIYGMSRCRDWAWKYMRDPCCAHINRDTVWNADNYAWYFANKYYAKTWGWGDDGSALTLDPSFGSEFDTGPPGEPLTDASSLPEPQWPPNCSPVPAVDAINVEIDCPRPPETCSCNESGCTDESPPCCANGTCP